MFCGHETECMALRQGLLNAANQCNTKIEQLYSQLKVTASTQRGEYLQLIKQDYNRVHARMNEVVQLNGKMMKLTNKKTFIGNLKGKEAISTLNLNSKKTI